jgi:hypothetical protein
MVCICGNHDHAWDEPTVCKDIDCKCTKYVEATETNIVLSKHVVYLQHFQSVKEQIRWLLVNLKFLRNLRNKNFIDFYFQHIKVYTPKGTPKSPDYETVRRCKQLLVAENSELYGPFDPNVTVEKSDKQISMEEFVTQ